MQRPQSQHSILVDLPMYGANTINGEINALTAKANRVLCIWK